jgi:hypothetical protein
MSSRRLHAPLPADLWRCQPTAGRGAVIVEAPSMFEARMTAVVRRMAPGVPFGESLTPPWRADKIPGGCVVRDANGQALAYIYCGAIRIRLPHCGRHDLGECGYRATAPCRCTAGAICAQIRGTRRAFWQFFGVSQCGKFTATQVWMGGTT